MQHILSDRVKVYKSTDYSRFKFIAGNRAINDKKLKNIIDEIDNGNDMLRYYPIQVKETNNKLEILDSQHRFYLSKFFQRPVYYILVEEEKKMVEIAKINSNVEKWTMNDFLNCYKNNGNENYALVEKFMKTYGFNYSIVLKLLSTGTPGNEGTNVDVNNEFKNGTYKVTFYKEAEDLAILCNLFNEFKYHASKSFIIAIYRIHKAGKISISDLAAAYKKRPHLLSLQANYKSYVNNLEQIVNVLKQKRIIII